LFKLIVSLGSWVEQSLEPLQNNSRILHFYCSLEDLGFIEVRQCESA
jgi:hypothetical protein